VSRRAWILAASAVALILLIAASVMALTREPDPVAVMKVEKKPYVRRVTAEGNLRSENSTPIKAPMESRGPAKISWIVDDGAVVAAGDVVVRFDATDFEREMIEGQESRSTAVNRISGAEALATGERTNLGRDAMMAQLELEAARSFQLTDAEIFSRYELIESSIDEDLAVEKKEYAEQMRRIRELLFGAEREILSIDQRKADIRLRRAADGLSALEVLAPAPGVFVLSRDWRGEAIRVGSSIWSGGTIGEIPDLDSMKVEAFVLEADAGGIAPGQTAEIVVEAHPERVLTGKVEKIDPVAKPRFRGSPVQYFGVTLTLDESDPNIMKPGSRVRATITLEQSESAIAIPRQAIHDDQGKRIVYRRTAKGTFEAVPVELGTSTVGTIVVTSGLSEGDVIALEKPADEFREEGDA
jgi:HlyD family secretion protein